MGALPVEPAAGRALRKMFLGAPDINGNPVRRLFASQGGQPFITFHAPAEKPRAYRQPEFPADLLDLARQLIVVDDPKADPTAPPMLEQSAIPRQDFAPFDSSPANQGLIVNRRLVRYIQSEDAKPFC